jgi:ADP-ribose pyrophosphatase
MSIKPWNILETKYLHPHIRLDRCELSNGYVLDYHLLEYDDEITVFALTRKQEVLLIKQYRHGVQQAILELPGGSVDEGETPLDAAKREMMEETGYSSETFIEVGCASPNPAIYTNKIYFFLAIDVERIGEQNIHDAGNIEVSLLPLEEVIAMAKQGTLVHALNISALFFVLGYFHRVV